MNALLRTLRRDLPDMVPHLAYDAALAVYVVRLTIEVLEQQELSVFESYFLKAVSLGVNTFPDIAHLLGLDEADLAPAGAKLLTLGLIEQGVPVHGVQRKIAMTPAGKQALLDKYAPPAPKKERCRLHFNTLTRSLM